MKCLNNCGKEASGKGKYCSDKCKVAYNRNKERNTATVTSPTVTRTFSKTFKDFSGKEHPIDYEGRRERKKILVSWAKGGGTNNQMILGKQAILYSHLKDVDLVNYLGLDETLKEFEKQGYYYPFWERETAIYHKAHPPDYERVKK